MIIEHNIDDELDGIQEQRRQHIESVKENILIAQQRQKEKYDRKHSNPEVFAVGALVLKKDFTHKKVLVGNWTPSGLAHTGLLIQSGGDSTGFKTCRARRL